MTYWGELSLSTDKVDGILGELTHLRGKATLPDGDRVLELLDQMVITRRGLGGPEWPIYVWEVSFPEHVEAELRDIIARANHED